MAGTTTESNRRYPRVGLPRGMTVAWQAGGERIISRIGTIGLGGLFIYTKKTAAVGDVVKLVFDVPGGEVRGMGVEFTAMQLEARARLTQLLRRLT
jgi:hypothetical protein